MPLLDHFHPPLRSTRHWESFHARWAVALADMLNLSLLPNDYVAEVHVHVGGRVEVDVGTFEEEPAGNTASAGTAVAPAPTWAPPAPRLQFPAVFSDSIELHVMNFDSGPTLVAAVELVSPGNKDRPDTRRAFAAKCATYLHEGIGLIVIDVVTERRGNLHNELIDLMGVGEQYRLADGTDLYAVAYRPVRRKEIEQIDAWPAPLAVGQSLPVLPLALGTRLCLPLDLEAAYMDACQRSRLVTPATPETNAG